MDELEGATGTYSIYGVGRWSAGRPVIWIRWGAALAALGYALVAAYNVSTRLPPAHSRVLEVAVAIVCGVAARLARRRPRLASGLVLSAIAMEVLISLASASDVGSLSSLLVIEVLVMSAGLFLGEWAVGVAALAGAVLVPVALAVSGRYGFLLRSMPPYDSALLVVFEACNGVLGLMTWLTLRTFTRVLAAAEERRRLELRLEHLQRLEVMGNMASGFAHDLKNVFSVVGGLSELLERHADAEVRDTAGDLERACKSGSAAVAHMLDMARREEPNRILLDLADGVERLRRVAARLIGPDHTLRLAAQGPAPALLDPLQLEQLVLNLVANARDATPPGGTISVAVRALARGDAAALGSTLAAPEQVLIEVRDEGSGVPAELQDRIFEPYFTSKPRGQGTGLGLATVRSITRSSRGCVTLQSAAGAGAAFRVFLPLATAASAAEAIPPAASGA